MKKSILSAFVLASIFSSCVKDIKKEEPNTTVVNPNPQTMQEMIVPAGFSYKTAEDVNFTVKLLANNDQPLGGVRIDIMDDSPENEGRIIATGITNNLGVLSMPYNIPIALTQVVLNIDYIGVVNNVIVPLDANNKSVNITLGGKNPMKVITAEEKNLAKPRVSLGKAFSRLSYRKGTFTTGTNGGVPN